MAISERTKYIICGILLIILGGVLLMKQSQKVEQKPGESQKVQYEDTSQLQENPETAPETQEDDQISVQEDTTGINSTYDADWQREESRLERSFSWLEDELKIAERTEELKIYSAYTKKLSQCPNGNWKCLEEIRWQLDDFAFAMKSIL